LKLIKHLLSFIFPITIERQSSEFNPLLEVVYESGRYMLNTENANYSFGTLHTKFQKIFREISIEKRNIRNVLILGFGAGSVASILINEYRFNCKITGVEIDSKVLELGEKYFNLKNYSNLNVICCDAYEYTMNASSTFDFIVLDIFKDMLVPEKFESRQFVEFIYKLSEQGGIFIFNKVMSVKRNYLEMDNLKDVYKSIFDKFTLLNISNEDIIFIAER
jgi:spermidine synthase